MKKSELQKPIRSVIEKFGFLRIKGDYYALDSKDLKTKLCLRIPDGKKGFILGVQFSDFGSFDGIEAHSVMQQFDHAYDLAYGITKDYSEEEILSVTEQVCSDYKPYYIFGAEEIKRKIEHWTFGDFDESFRNNVLQYLGQTQIDPYSEEYLQNNADELTRNGGMIVLTEDEYMNHKSFYDKYIEHGAKIEIKGETQVVTISFFDTRKWYQR